MAPSPPTAGILIIGDEILSGRTQDVNVCYLGKRLQELGIQLCQVRILPDQEDIIAQDVLAFSKKYSYVFTTGGIGPTHDDITAQSIAKAFHVPLETHPDALGLLQQRKPNQELNPSQLKMASVPEGASLIDNPITYAPGFFLRNVFVLAGVPQIMQAMFENCLHLLQPGNPFYQHTLKCLLGESVLAPGLEAIQTRHPEVSIGSYPFWGNDTHGASIVVRSQDQKAVHGVAKKVEHLIQSLGGTLVE